MRARFIVYLIAQYLGGVQNAREALGLLEERKEIEGGKKVN